jgi:hypothetical protein
MSEFLEALLAMPKTGAMPLKGLSSSANLKLLRHAGRAQTSKAVKLRKLRGGDVMDEILDTRATVRTGKVPTASIEPLALEFLSKVAGLGGRVVTSQSAVKPPKVPGLKSDRVVGSGSKLKPARGRAIGKGSKLMHPDINPRGVFAEMAAQQRARKKQLMGR